MGAKSDKAENKTKEVRYIALFTRRKKYAAASVQTRPAEYGGLPIMAGEQALYRAMRENVPMIDACIYKLRRLIGDF